MKHSSELTKKHKVTVSIGIAELKRAISRVFGVADKNLYSAKELRA